MPASVVNEIALLRRYGVAAQRFACYPGFERFTAETDGSAYLQQLQQPVVGGIAPALSLYVRGPRDKALAAHVGGAAVWLRPYLRSLGRELDLLAASQPGPRNVANLFCRSDTAHAGHVLEMIRNAFGVAAGGEHAIGTELCRLQPQHLSALCAHGFNQLRIETCDTCNACAAEAPDLQRSVQRARECGFQTVEVVRPLDGKAGGQFLRELARLIGAAPDRLILPTDTWLTKPSRARLEFMRTVVATIEAADYVHFGMDYFVRSNDPLLRARRRGGLSYGLRGFSLGAIGISLGLGPAAISKLPPYYSQNEESFTQYLAALDQRRLPVQRGLRLNFDDQIRRAVIQALICHLEVPFESINDAYLLDFRQRFAAELAQLEPFVRAGAVELNDDWISVTPRGRLLLPAIGGVFANGAPQVQFQHAEAT